MDIESIKPERRIRTEIGIRLPYRIERKHWNAEAARMEIYEVDEGTVFISWSEIENLVNQGTLDSLGTGNSLILGYLEGLALEQAGFAVQETRGGYHASEQAEALEQHLMNAYQNVADPVERLRALFEDEGGAADLQDYPEFVDAISAVLASR